MRSAFRILLLAWLAASAAEDTVARIAAVQATLPWFWSVTAEGMSDIPYTYQLRTTRRLLSRDGQEIPPAAGANPLGNWRSLHFERIPLDWGGAFPAAFRFEPGGPGELRFTRPRGSGLLGAIAGRLWFDPATHEITRMEYDVLKDIDEPFGKLPKGARFEITLVRVDGHYIPGRTFVRRRFTKDGALDERTSLYSDFKRFVSESNIQFVDK